MRTKERLARVTYRLTNPEEGASSLLSGGSLASLVQWGAEVRLTT
ncbi:hypothetical protein CfE428DRAFT_4483 [Chthoniobacter flavus Ellin428]|uniref:Uncharacterized protein n=1 Tax=Chthoniobacter flavus Ellin428 TaxID=497964 RepID=B4D6E3_9BACT|nr:hypothetical protein CfE428DRAFT_4483 [Chthoniobacter flavus Ellin428]